MDAVTNVLTSLSLSKYAKALRKRGWDDLDVLMGLDENGLWSVAASVKMKEGHSTKFVGALLKLGDRTPPASGQSSPRAIESDLWPTEEAVPTAPTESFTTTVHRGAPEAPLGLLLAGSRGWYVDAEPHVPEGEAAESAVSYLTVCEVVGVVVTGPVLLLGDLISSVNGVPVTTLSQAAAELKSAKNEVVLGVTRILDEALLAGVLEEVSAISQMRHSRQQSALCAREAAEVSEALQRSAAEHTAAIEATDVAQIVEDARVLSTLELSLAATKAEANAASPDAAGPSADPLLLDPFGPGGASLEGSEPQMLTPRTRHASSSALLEPRDAAASPKTARVLRGEGESVYEAQLAFLLVHESGAAGQFV